MDEEERIRRFCHAYAMAQRVLDMAAEQPIHTGMARDEARRQLAIAFKLFPETIKARIRKLYEHADAKRTVRQSHMTESVSTEK